MKFALNYFYNPEYTGPTNAEVKDWMVFDSAVKGARVFVYEAGFQPAEAAQTVSVRTGWLSTAPGAATNGDVLAGFYVLDVADLQAALAWAQKVPTAKYGKVEVRQVVCKGDADRAGRS